MRLPVGRLATSVALLLLAASFPAEAQPTGKVPRIGVLGGEPASGWNGLREGLRELGYVDGQNVAIEWREAGADAKRFSSLAEELVRLKVDLIVASNNAATAAAQSATRTIPIVMVFTLDAVRDGFVGSLARPGGNTTGVSAQHTDVASKGVQFLKEAAPNLSRLGILWDPAIPGMQRSVEATKIAAETLRIQVQILEARSPDELVRAFGEMVTARVNAVVVHGSNMLFTNRRRIADQAKNNRLPALCSLGQYVEAGCLMSYWVSLPAQYRRVAYFVDRILNGTKPADLPVEQPTKFELVINTKTAKSLGLTIPPSLLLRADRVIE